MFYILIQHNKTRFFIKKNFSALFYLFLSCCSFLTLINTLGLLLLVSLSHFSYYNIRF